MQLCKYLLEKRVFIQSSAWILCLFASFFLLSCVTPKPGTVSDYRVNPVTGEKTCKVYVNIQYNQYVQEGRFRIEGVVTLTKKGNGKVDVDVPDDIMKTEILSTNTTSNNLQKQFAIDKPTADEIATALIACHENRHKHDHVENPALALIKIEGVESSLDSLRPAVKLKLEQNATGAESMLLATILRAGNGDLSKGWEKIRDEGQFDSKRGLNFDYLKEEIYKGERKTDPLEGVDLYEQEASAFTKSAHAGAMIEGTNGSYSYSGAFVQFIQKGYTDFNDLETEIYAAVSKLFELLEKTRKITDDRRKSGKNLFGQNFVSHVLEFGKNSVSLSKITQDLLNNNSNNTRRPAASGNNYCWSCRVQDPGVSRCIQPSCPNYGNPPSMAR